MSICGGIAGRRGKNPVGIFIHNDAGGQAMNAAYWANALANGTHDPEAGFAHAYCGNDGIRVVEDDANCAWHCGQTDGNTNYLSIEVCQSMGDLDTFKANEERALQWCAEKCKLYGITPNNNTIKLHKEVSATACPHRSVEIHGGDAKTKAYFIERIKALMRDGKWVKNETGWWYQYADGTWPKNQWLKLDTWYYFNERGYAVHDDWVYYKNKWYYLKSDCRIATGWVKVKGYWYYLDKNGAMLTRWQKINGYWYYLRPAKDGDIPEGTAVTGWIFIKNYWYYLLPKKDGNKPECSAAVGWYKVDGEWYYFNSANNCQPACSMMQNHWITTNKKKYYLKDDGKMARGETIQIGGIDYRFDDSGALV